MEDTEMSMAPGFRFYPTEEELISFYLHHKLERQREDLINRLMDRVIPIVDIYEYNPWDLPKFSVQLCHKDPEQWFFFIPRQESEARGGRPRRLTTTGYWKATGSPGDVYSSTNRPIGFKRTMVFYKGRAPNGRKTEWKMNEYKAIVEAASPGGANPTLRHEFSLCRIYKKSKCLRSFDRRPVAAGRELQILHEPPAVDHHHQGQATSGAAAAAAASHQQSDRPQLMEDVAERSMSSTESSSSGDHGNYPIISQTGEPSNSSSTKLVDSDESFWYLVNGFWEYSMK